MLSINKLLVIPTLLLTSLSFGAEFEYKCEVLKVFSLTEDSYLSGTNWDKMMAGSEFTVSKETGEIVGKVVPTINATDYGVSNHGDSEWSFKSLATFNNEVIQILEIKEFLSTPIKPSISISMRGAGLVTEVCR